MAVRSIRVPRRTGVGDGGIGGKTEIPIVRGVDAARRASDVIRKAIDFRVKAQRRAEPRRLARPARFRDVIAEVLHGDADGVGRGVHVRGVRHRRSAVGEEEVVDVAPGRVGRCVVLDISGDEVGGLDARGVGAEIQARHGDEVVVLLGRVVTRDSVRPDEDFRVVRGGRRRLGVCAGDGAKHAAERSEEEGGAGAQHELSPLK